jgi:hypothetical protein
LGPQRDAIAAVLIIMPTFPLSASAFGLVLAFAATAFEPATAQSVPESPSKPAAEAPTRSSLDLSVRALEEASKGNVTFDVTNAELSDALASFQALSGLPLRIEWSALADLGIAKDDVIDVHVHDVPPLVALKAIAATINADIDRPVVEAAAGQIVLTSPRGLGAFRELAMYDVADILADPMLIDAVAAAVRAQRAAEQHIGAKEEEEAEGKGDDANSTAGSTAGSAAAFSPLTARGDRLIEIIVDHIDPEGWDDNGGSRGRMSHEAGRLLVTATPSTHQALRTLLADLRRTSPTAATTTWTVASVPTATLDALLAKPEFAGPMNTPALDAAIRAASGFKALSKQQVTSKLGEEAVVDLGDGRNGSHCVANVTLDRARGTLSVQTKMTLFAGSWKVDSSTTLVGGPQSAAGIIRLPNSPVEGQDWVVLVVTVAEQRG